MRRVLIIGAVGQDGTYLSDQMIVDEIDVFSCKRLLQKNTAASLGRHSFSALSMDYREYVTETPSVLQQANRQVPFHGDASRLRAITGWKLEVSFDNLVGMMVRLEMDAAHAE